MRLFSYCIPIDDGAAPNPYWDVCTLTICKPVIRRVAEIGDWIVGTGSKNVGGKDYSGKLVYAMKVTQKMSLRKYDETCRLIHPGKIPDINSTVFEKRMGDCIYDYSIEGHEPKLRDSVHGQNNMDRDIRGLNALLSDEFYYFGDAAVDIPDDYSVLIRQGQGHQSTRNQFIKDNFVNWLKSNHERNKLYGKPQVEIEFTSNHKGNHCATKRFTCAEEDELADYTDEKLPLSHWQYFLALESDLKTLSRYVEIHESNYSTFSIGLTQLLMSTCAECEIVIRGICRLLIGREGANMSEWGQVLLSKIQNIPTKKVYIPLYNISLSPFSSWSAGKSMDWWSDYNKVKHNRGTHYDKANLENCLKALGALYILIFEYLRLHRGNEEGAFSTFFIYKHLQPKQELFLLSEEELQREIGEGKRNFFPGR